MITTRPHILQYLISTEGYEAPNGDWVAGEESYTGNIPCLFKPYGQDKEMTFDDGVRSIVSGSVRLDVDSRTFTYGEKIRVLFNGEVIAEREVKGFQRGQLGNRIWT